MWQVSANRLRLIDLSGSNNPMITTIILAAGGSTRLGGTPKQLLETYGTSLVRRMTNMALSLETGPVLVVLGANQEKIQTELKGLSVQIVVNPNWQEGLASSLRVGLQVLSDTSNTGLKPGANDPHPDLRRVSTRRLPPPAFLILLTDQPFVTADLLHQLITTQQQTGKGIVACRYGEMGHLGVPALFAIHYKDDFMKLSGDVGARKLIQQHLEDCADVPFPLGAIDLDTPQDVKNWQDM